VLVFRSRSRSQLVAVGVAAFAAVSLAACSSGGSSPFVPKRSTTTTSTSTSTSTTTTTIAESADGPCGDQAVDIVAAVTNSTVAGLDQRKGEFTVEHCRLAGSPAVWASTDAVPLPGVPFDQAKVVLHKDGGTWIVADIGTADTGCDDVPADLQEALDLVCS
jgi:hypothetical protein